MIDVIAFDADDTLWHNESLFSMTQDKFKRLLSKYHDPEWINQKLYETETRNLQYFGYGIKGFTLSMIETAIELTEGRIQGREIQEIIDFAKEMLRTPVRLLEQVEETVVKLAESHRLMIITKGDLFDQETKIAQSGIADYFERVEIVSDKTEETYQAILIRHTIDPPRFLMVGNSLKSDIWPVIAIGGRAAHIPYHITWAHEAATGEDPQPDGYFRLDHIGQLPALIERLCQSDVKSCDKEGER